MATAAAVGNHFLIPILTSNIRPWSSSSSSAGFLTLPTNSIFCSSPFLSSRSQTLPFSGNRQRRLRAGTDSYCSEQPSDVAFATPSYHSHSDPALESTSFQPKKEEEEEDGEEDEEEEDGVVVVEEEKPKSPTSLPFRPTLTIKEKKELASYAHIMGKKLKVQQIGKSGVTPSAAASFVENLERNELLKIKVHGNCPGEFTDVVRQLEDTTCSTVVAQIGRSVILYRPSISKMKKRESEESARRIWKLKPKRSMIYSGIGRGQLPSRSSGGSIRRGK